MRIELTVCVLITLISMTIGYGARSRSSSNYRIPAARVEPLTPKGLRVSIAHEPGLELFAFHGMINTEINGFDNGNLSADILQPINGRWVFYDKDIQLKAGDVINYWLFVQKNGLGYRKDGERYTVRGLATTSPNLQQLPSTSTIIPSTMCNESELEQLRQQYNETVLLLLDLNSKMEPLIEEVRILREVITDLTSTSSNNSTLLLLSSNVAMSPSSPLEFVRSIITQKLSLPNYYSKILSATQRTAGIVFDVATLFDKRLLISRARESLKSSRYRIEDYIEPPNTVNPLSTVAGRSIDTDALSDDEVAKRIDVRMASDDHVGTVSEL